MFTGIVKGVGRVVEIVDGRGPRRLRIEAKGLAAGTWQAGDSIAVAGVCLTITSLAEARFEAELSEETLRATTLGQLVRGDPVNLEPALAAGSPLGGHLVTGHVDGIARVRGVEPLQASVRAAIETPAGLERFLAPKGSVTLDGVSLTVGDVDGALFDVHLVPHTRASSTLGTLRTGQQLNLEVDLVARYLERLLAARAGR
jgi:riboflavin synthase